MTPGMSEVMTSGAAARSSAHCAPPLIAAERYSTAVGMTETFFADAKIGDVGIASGTEASTIGVSCDIVSSWRLVSGWGSFASSSTTSGSGSEAAICSMTASANAGTLTIESSCRSADETIITPFLSYLNLRGTAPTETESYADI